MSIIVPVDRTTSIIPVSRRNQGQYPPGESAPDTSHQPRGDRGQKPALVPADSAHTKAPDTTCGQIINTFALLG